MSKSSEVGCREIAPRVREPLSVPAAVELSALLKTVSDPIRLCLLSVIASHGGAYGGRRGGDT
ncbi:hypothetical protein ACXDF8_26375 [Mycolicibacterium sp. CBM1]